MSARGRRVRTLLLVAAAFGVGWGSGYLRGKAVAGDAPGDPAASLFEAHSIGVRYGDLGPRLVEAGAIDPDRMAARLAGLGMPMTDAQRRLLLEGGDDDVEMDRASAPFLLHFFWAVGLANQSPILSEGPMMGYGEEQVVRFASTDGWRLGARPVAEIYGRTPLVTLDDAQLARLERVARAVYRPCCDNPTHFPDCNHGMAMLGMLTLMAADGADDARIFEAAAAANAFWYPAQYRQLAVWLETAEGKGVDEVEAQRLVAREVASGSGFQAVRRSLAQVGLLAPAPNAGTSAC